MFIEKTKVILKVYLCAFCNNFSGGQLTHTILHCSSSGVVAIRTHKKRTLKSYFEKKIGKTQHST